MDCTVWPAAQVYLMSLPCSVYSVVCACVYASLCVSVVCACMYASLCVSVVCLCVSVACQCGVPVCTSAYVYSVVYTLRNNFIYFLASLVCFKWKISLQVVNFYFVPPAWRVTYNSVMTFLWTVFLSYMKHVSKGSHSSMIHPCSSPSNEEDT